MTEKPDNPRGRNLWAHPDAAVLWASARGELLCLADHLASTGATITADQLRMAVAGGDLVRASKEAS